MCGGNMQRASALQRVVQEPTGPMPVVPTTAGEGDRRLSESNRQWLGRVVDGRYRVIEVIGRGGMGVVYKVEHLRMGKIAAMKVLHRDLAQDPTVVQRFEREATTVSRLNHPNTVQVFDFGTTGGAMYLIMEYVRGRDLAAVVERDGPLSFARLGPLLVQICGSLQEAHEAGVVHRDLKPENVIVSRTTRGRDFSKVLDFGLAKLGARETPANVTDRTQIVGTPYYMAPEQIRGDEVDGRTDIYALGAMMFKLLTGEQVHSAGSPIGILTKHLTVEPDAPSQRAPSRGIDPRVDHLCVKALAKDPAARWQSVAELLAEVEDAYLELIGDATGAGVSRPQRSPSISQETSGVVAAPSDLALKRSDLDAFERKLRRRRFVVAGVAVAMVAGGAGASTWWLSRPAATFSSEQEPNGELAQATRIASGHTVAGYLGQRRSATEADRDFFLLDAESTRKRLLSVSLSAIPNMDVVLILRDTEGATLTVADEGAADRSEAVRRRWLTGPVIIEVGQRPLPGQMRAVENVSDPYHLQIVEESADPQWESEPNGSATDATPLSLEHAVRGHLDGRADVDVLTWVGPSSRYRLEVAAGEIPVTLRGPDGVSFAGPIVDLGLRTGDLLRLERSDRERPHGDLLPGSDATWTITAKARPFLD
jgi:serine/threonine-protein kinase